MANSSYAEKVHGLLVVIQYVDDIKDVNIVLLLKNEPAWYDVLLEKEVSSFTHPIHMCPNVSPSDS